MPIMLRLGMTLVLQHDGLQYVGVLLGCVCGAPGSGAGNEKKLPFGNSLYRIQINGGMRVGSDVPTQQFGHYRLLRVVKQSLVRETDS